jgi:TonB family protein
MLHPFISSPATQAPRGHVAGASLSVIVHTVLITGAVAATSVSAARTLGGDVRHVRPTETVRYVRSIPRAETAAPRRTEGTALSRALARLSALPAINPIELPELAMSDPEIDLTGYATDPAVGASDFATNTMADMITAALQRMFPTPAGGAYSESVVEKVAWPRRENPRPAYPPSMLSAGIEASVTVSFVVDSTGRVDEKSMNVPATAHRLFVDAIKRALLRSRYYPAEIGGHRVAQHVRQEFIFRIER